MELQLHTVLQYGKGAGHAEDGVAGRRLSFLCACSTGAGEAGVWPGSRGSVLFLTGRANALTAALRGTCSLYDPKLRGDRRCWELRITFCSQSRSMQHRSAAAQCLLYGHASVQV